VSKVFTEQLWAPLRYLRTSHVDAPPIGLGQPPQVWLALNPRMSLPCRIWRYSFLPCPLRQLLIFKPSTVVNMDMPVNVPVDNPNADTEWSDSFHVLSSFAKSTLQERHPTETQNHPRETTRS
jgi:hypothetical protein